MSTWSDKRMKRGLIKGVNVVNRRDDYRSLIGLSSFTSLDAALV